MRHWILSSLIAIAATAAGATAANAEDDAPWTPKRYSVSELIDFGTFGHSPLKLPWKVVRIEEMTNYGRVDFKHVLEADVRTDQSYFDKKYKEQKPALRLKKGLVPTDKSRKLTVIGTARQQDVRNYTLGNGDLRRNFIVRLKEQDGRAVLIYQNMALTQVFGAGAPQLAPFKPVDADPIPVR
ncbi:MAG: hypothetical protein ABEN55_16350 [Bradymonadaceae bacterium]